MQARVKWVEGLSFIGESASGHQVLMDGNSGDKAPSPMEMVLMATGSCSAIDVVSILQKGRQDVVDCEVKLTSERREEAPRLFTHINLHFVVTGRSLTDAVVERAVTLSADKYCSVALMLGKGVEITHSFEVISL
ncbi:OsmC family protein [Tatumella sp. UCD-D_suzukii]|uniref:OsmC family protein n=1 Tax=Tatumella sp. UCD-D_suzukii TaxID=1408192 RepID=UPI00046EB2E5|nr:OsmC family protein [Tatumella sp. UCD-D_suzukii]